MNTILTPKRALKQILVFSLPIIFGHLGLMLIGTGDMIIAGRYSRECLAAIGLAISIGNPVMMLGLGILFAISPILAQKRGRGENIQDHFWTVVTFSLLIGAVASILTYASVSLLPLLGYPDNLNVIIREYLIILSPSLIFQCLYQGLKEFFQSQEKTISANVVAMVSAGLNLALNYAFVFGAWGFPELKEPGLAWASLTLRAFMGLALLAVAYRCFGSKKKIDFSFYKEVFKLGVPITISIFFEVMAFCSVTLFVGKFAEIQVAANNIALNYASLVFMVPMSIAAAVGVKVGHAYGEGNFHAMRTYARMSLVASVAFTACMGFFTYFCSDFILSLYSKDLDVLGWGRTLLFWVACFQVFDGAQITLSGILRGLSITKASSIGIFIGYWLIGIPLGYFLGFHRGFEAQGFWMGLALSLSLVALILGIILKRKMKTLVKEIA